MVSSHLILDSFFKGFQSNNTETTKILHKWPLIVGIHRWPSLEFFGVNSVYFARPVRLNHDRLIICNHHTHLYPHNSLEIANDGKNITTQLKDCMRTMVVRIRTNTSWHGNVFRIAGPYEVINREPTDSNFDIFFAVKLNKMLNKYSFCRGFYASL